MKVIKNIKLPDGNTYKIGGGLDDKITNCITEIPQDIKLELEPLNADIVGTVTNNTGVISGFSASNYLTLPKTFNTGQNWEIVFKATLAESEYTYQCMLGYNYLIGLCVKTTTDGMVVHLNLGDGSTWASGCNGTEKLVAGETYWFKASKVGNVTTVQHSTDNKTWITDGTLETSFTSQNQLWVGNINTSNQVFHGSIDLPNCYIKVNGSIWWQGGTGVLTLKAGSKVYVPNGFEADGTTTKFDEVVVPNDMKTTNFWGDVRFVAYSPNRGLLPMPVSASFSSATQPSTAQYALWYDTANNLVKFTSDNGATWLIGYSLPICTAYGTNGAIVTRIDQTFNGFGYIGSTVFVTKGVKGLIPNGRNEDGTLNNIEITTQKVMTKTDTGTHNFTMLFTEYDLQNYLTVNYDAESNYNLSSNNGVITRCVGGTFSRTDGVISNFNPKLPFRAVDYSDSSTVSGWSMPSNKYIDLTLGASGTKYTAPANGWFTLRKIANSDGSSNDKYCDMYNNTSSIGVHNNGMHAFQFICTIPALKGDIIQINYNATGNTNLFRFIYAEGEV